MKALKILICICIFPSFLLAKDISEMIKEGDLAALKDFIEKNSYDLSKDHLIEKQSLLHLAAYYNQAPIIRYLVQHGVDPNLMFENTALHLAAKQENNFESIKALMEAGADPNTKNFEGKTSFHIAVEYSDSRTLSFMLSNGARVNERTNRNQTALHIAGVKRTPEILEILIKNKADLEIKDDEAYTAFHRAVQMGLKNADNITYFIKVGDNLLFENKFGQALILDLHEMLKSGLKKESTRDKVLALQTSILQFVHERFPGITQSFNEKLRQADPEMSFQDYSEQVKDMIIKEWSPLHKAVFYSDFRKAKSLIAGGADVNIKDKHGWSPLFIAYFTADLKMVDLLLENKANINALDNHGNNILFCLTESIKEAVFKHLIEKGININAINKLTGNTILHEAVMRDQKLLVELLVKHGVLTGRKNYSKKTPLALASELKDPYIKNFLQSKISSRSLIHRGQKAFKTLRSRLFNVRK